MTFIWQSVWKIASTYLLSYTNSHATEHQAHPVSILHTLENLTGNITFLFSSLPEWTYAGQREHAPLIPKGEWQGYALIVFPSFFHPIRIWGMHTHPMYFSSYQSEMLSMGSAPLFTVPNHCAKGSYWKILCNKLVASLPENNRFWERYDVLFYVFLCKNVSWLS